MRDSRDDSVRHSGKPKPISIVLQTVRDNTVKRETGKYKK